MKNEITEHTNTHLEELRLGFLASHNGSSVRAIVEAIEGEDLSALPAMIISNNSDSGALEYARQKGIPHRHLSRKTEGDEDGLDRAILMAMKEANVNLIIMSGWMILVGPRTTNEYRGRILNSHPALFSSEFKGKGFYGDNVHRAVLDARMKKTGVTIHVVDAEMDHGRILAEAEVPVHKRDTVETLRERVKSKEQKLYVEVLQKISVGAIRLG